MRKLYIFRLNERTSGDGVDASIIKSNGVDKYEVVVTVIMSMILQSIKIYTL